MKKRHYATILVLLVALLFWALFRKKTEPTATSLPMQAQSQQSAQARPLVPSPTNEHGKPLLEALPSAQSQIDHIGGAPISPAVSRYVQNVKADPQYDWKQPINFYGKVVDESNQPVEGASVSFKWTDLSPGGASEYHTTSDADGLFSMLNQTGKRLSVTASKEGYYTSGDARQASFEYANPADGLFTPDPVNPVVVHLRKKSAGVDLVTSQNGISPDLSVNVPRDGTPIKVNLLDRKSGGEEGQIILSQTKPVYEKWKQATEWSFRMEIPDGGFVEEKDEFPFDAPEDGYQSAMQFDFQQGQTNWAVGLTKNFYFKFGNPPRYGRIQVQTGISYGGAVITYAINPDGSRNLEPK